MLILKNSCFIHVPKTGGTWVRHALLKAGADFEYYTLNGTSHISLADCPCPERFKFAFVRHPLGLYKSYWQFKMTYGWDDGNALDNACRTDSFREFILGVTSRFPGAYGNGLNDMIGPEDRPIEFVGRYENLLEDLVTALTRAGESFDEARLRAAAPVNVSDKLRFPARYTPDLVERVVAVEQEVFRRFNYCPEHWH
ncbi:MAG: hypothetical protein KGI47_06860 [Betaproteobacteria bacterium]|nr:hypothetical protein [Betaproteobacteria bacterium]